MLSCEVPGVSIARSSQRRGATGRAWICWFEVRGQSVIARGVSARGAHEPSLYVASRHGDARQDAAALVLDVPDNLRVLCVRAGADEHEGGEHQQEQSLPHDILLDQLPAS